jgi:cell division protein FtsI/penicillin-binding protein 2
VFERRLKVLLGLFGLVGAVLLLRLGQLQLLQADEYRRRAASVMVQRPASLPFVRGDIVDRSGRVLVADEPCWDITLDYTVIAADVGGDAQAFARLLRQGRRRLEARSITRPQLSSEPRASDHVDSNKLGTSHESISTSPEPLSQTELTLALEDELLSMWSNLARFAADRYHRQPQDERAGPRAVEPWRDIATPTPAMLRTQARSIYERVQTIREAVAARRGFDAPVAEEHERHAIIAGLTADEQIFARERLAPYPYVRIEPSSVRRFQGDTTSLAHVLGRMGRVMRDDIDDDPNAGDPFAEYRADEQRGISGVEWLAEQRLRGRRGQITLDRDGRILERESFPAQHGKSVAITIDRALQDRLCDLLGEAVREVPSSSGGAIVVLDVPTREVLALVSYPSYDPAQFDDRYTDLRDDTERLPLWFRAVASRYAPGSTVKPLVCLAGLINGVITPDTRDTCTGYLIDDLRDRWRCWRIHGTDQRKAHGSINVVQALVGSCNVFLYRLGESLGVDGLCSAFDMVGIGRTTGIGLREEDVGINPTPGWLMANKNIRATGGTARLFAIGQGEVSLTPLQLANLMATYANGRFMNVRLLQSEESNPAWELPASHDHWLAIRRGMYGVVNDRNGTAYDYAHFVHPRYALVGKTGSATAYPWPTAFYVSYTDIAEPPAIGWAVPTLPRATTDNGKHDGKRQVSPGENDDRQRSPGEVGVALIKAGTRQAALELFALEYPTKTPGEVEIARRWPEIPAPAGDNHAHAWFGGFLQPLDPSAQPDWSRESRFAFAALIEFGGSGGRVSGPLAQRIAGILVEFAEAP